MQPKDTFGVVIRVIGLLVSLIALLYLVTGALVWIVPNYRPNVSPSWVYFLIGAVALALGLYLLRGAPHIIRFAYPDKDSKDNSEHNI